MIARLSIAVPFAIVLPEGAEFLMYTSELAGYTIAARPPMKSDYPFHGDVPDSVMINDITGFVCNALQFDFHREYYDRSKNNQNFDPPVELMERVVSVFLTRLRLISRGAHIQSIHLRGGVPWRVQYLNDDGSELTEDPSKIRAFSNRVFTFALTGITSEVWDRIHEHDSEWIPPVWTEILLDAENALPRVGTAVVLAATALEVFIAEVLARLAEDDTIPRDIWKWINSRPHFESEPSTEEQFDTLLKHFTTHSLKENSSLWQSFKDLRTSRNKFVHEGVARVGRTPVSVDKAREFVAKANEIVKTVRDWLPEHKKWESLETTVKFQFQFPLT